MELVSKIEATLTEQYKKAPHLPEGGRKWLAEYAWVIVLVGVVISVLGLFGILSVLGLALIGLSLGGVAVGGLFGMSVGAAIGSVVLILTLLTLAVYIVEVVLLGMAVSPLKDRRKKGWNYVFIVFLLNGVLAIISGILSSELVTLVFSLLWIAIGGYFLFEVRDYFTVKKAVVKSTAADAKAKA